MTRNSARYNAILCLRVTGLQRWFGRPAADLRAGGPAADGAEVVFVLRGDDRQQHISFAVGFWGKGTALVPYLFLLDVSLVGARTI